MKVNFKNFIFIALIILLMLPVSSVSAGSATGLNPLSYVVQEGWKVLDSSVSVTSATNNWSDGYIDFDVTSGKDVGDQFRILSSGSLSVVGDAISWGGTRIGTIDPTYDGSNGKLRINFSATLYNSGFETGNFDGWTVNNSYRSADGLTHTQSARVQSAIKNEGSYAAELKIDGTTSRYGVGQGPEITSSTFYAQAGNTLSVKWNALNTSDEYDVYGFLVNATTGAQQQLFYGRGDSTNGWNTINASVNTTVCPSGTCAMKFRFLCGSYDATGGTVIGSVMYIDGISVVTSVATDAAVDYIFEHLEYRNVSNSPTMNKTYTVTMKDTSSTGTASSTITLTKANTATAITGITPEPSVYGQNYSIGVSVTALSPSTGTPIGTVVISDGSNTCNATLSGGTGSCYLPSTSIGNKSISATYQSTTAYNSSNASSSHTVNKANPSVMIVDSPDPSVFGENYAVRVTVSAVSPGSGTPSGTVVVNDGVGNSCNIPLLSGTGSCNLPSTEVGGKTISANYAGDANFNTAGNTTIHTVNKSNTITTITSDLPDPSVFGQDYPVVVRVVAATPGAGTPAGTVLISDGAGNSCNAPLLSGIGSCDLPSTAPGNKTISASYPGNTDFNPSSDIDNHVVTKAETTTTITSDLPDSSVYGQNYTVAVNVAPVSPGAGTPAGNVTVSDGGGNSCNITLTSGVGSCDLPSTVPGNKTISASYSESTFFKGSSDTESHVVNKADTTTTITSDSPDPSVYGQNYTVAVNVAAVAPGVGTPGGTVTVSDGEDNSCVITLTDGAGSCDLQSTVPGNKTLSASYSGNTYFNVSNDTESHLINKAGTTTTITSDLPDPSVYGQMFTVAVNVAAIAPGAGTPAGTVAVNDGAGNTCDFTLSSGEGSCELSSTSAEGKTLTATYAESTNFLESTISTDHSVIKADTEMSVDRSIISPVFGQPLSLSADVSVLSPGSYTPSGPVQFYMDGQPFGSTVSLSSGSASSIATTGLNAGEHTYYADFLGDANNNASSTLPAANFTIAKNDTSIAVVSSNASSVYGQPIQLTATVDEIVPSVVTPVGNVQFYFNGAEIGSPVALDEGVALSADLHTLVPPEYLLADHIVVGEYTFSAEYLGNSNSVGSISSVEDQVITPAATEVTISSSENPSVYGTNLNMTIKVTQQTESLTIPTGQVQLWIDGVKFLTSLPLNGDGEAVRSVPYLNLWPGVHAVTAYYTPSSPIQFVASDNTGENEPLIQEVRKAPASFTITPSVEAPVASQLISFSVQLAHPFRPEVVPTGTVKFFIDGLPFGDSVTLDAEGKGQSPESTRLSAGEHEIIVSFTGDDYFFDVEESPALTQSIAKADTLVEIQSVNPLSVVVGQATQISFKVSELSPAVQIPYGKVVVSNGLDECEAVLDDQGEGSCELASTSPGEKSLLATYEGSDDHNTSQSVEFVGLIVSKADSDVSISDFSPEHPVTGQPVTIRFSVIPVAPGWGKPTGTVTISDGNGRICEANIAEDGSGECQITFEVSGPITLNAEYAGDDNFNPDTFEGFSSLKIFKAHTSLGLVTSVTPSKYGQSVSFTASISVNDPGSGQPGGYVQFSIDGSIFGEPVAIEAGNAESNTINNLVVGAHAISAEYLGDVNFNGSSASVINQDVDKADSTLVLTSNQNPSPYGLSVLVTAQMMGVYPSELIPASGSVQFIVDGVPYGAPVPVNSEGKASKLLPYTALWVGTHPITAIYSGNDWYHGSNNLSEPWMQVVEKGDLTILVDYSIESPVSGQPFNITGQVVGNDTNNPKLTGSLQFYVNDSLVGTEKQLDLTSSATSDEAGGFGFGTQAVKLVYSGDDYYKAHTVETTILVEKANTTVQITEFTPTTVVVGEKATVSYSVEVQLPGAGVATGSVTISNGVDECSGTLTDGIGSCDLIPTTSGNQALTAEYSGDDHFNRSDSADEISGFTVEKASISLSITNMPAGPFVIGQAYAITVQISPVEPGSFIPAGSTITIGNGVDQCEATVQLDGSATCDITPSSAGNSDFVATFTGNADFNAAASDPVAGPEVVKANTQVNIATSINPAVESSELVFTATITVVSPGAGNPDGFIQFVVDGNNVGEPIAIQDGKAYSSTITNLGVGIHAVKAMYLESELFNSSASDELSQKVVAGNDSEIVTPGEGQTITYHGMQNGLPVTTVVVIPADAVDEEVIVVYRQFADSLLQKPEGMDFVTNFVLEVYKNGDLQVGYEFLKPVQISMGYNPKEWNVESFEVMSWMNTDIKSWQVDGIEILEHDYENNKIVFTVQNTTPEQFSLVGVHKYLFYLPLINN
jgi:hypothetical protein